jgi:hypothetical protein
MTWLVRFYAPFVLAVIAAVGTLSDFFQNPAAMWWTAIALAAFGALLIVARIVPPLRGLAHAIYPDARAAGVAGFALFCFIGAGVLYAYAEVSARLAPQGGVIGAAYPELREIQKTLGVVETTVARIEEKTEAIGEDVTFIRGGVPQMLKVYEIYDAPEMGGVQVRVGNDTEFAFSDVLVELSANGSAGARRLARFTEAGLAPGAEIWGNFTGYDPSAPVSICIVGSRDGDGVRIRTVQTYDWRVRKFGPIEQRYLQGSGRLQIERVSDGAACAA